MKVEERSPSEACPHYKTCSEIRQSLIPEPPGDLPTIEEAKTSFLPASFLYSTPPSLQDMLLDRIRPPLSLANFKSYLAQHHCLETLTFITDAMRYKITHAEILSTESINSEARIELIRAQWQRLMETYILPCGNQALNLPSPTRDRLLAVPITAIPIYPPELDDTIAMVYEMISQSVLVPFLESAISSNERQVTTASSVPGRRNGLPTCLAGEKAASEVTTLDDRFNHICQMYRAPTPGHCCIQERVEQASPEVCHSQEQRQPNSSLLALALVTRTLLIGTRRTNVRSGISPYPGTFGRSGP